MHPYGLQMTSDKPALTASTEWTERVYELQKTDPVDAGADGIDNLAPNQLTARTNYLRVKGIADWAAVWNYPAGAFCQISGVVYRAVTANAGKPPASNPAIWTLCPMTAPEIANAINLSGYATDDELSTGLAGKAPLSHSHATAQIAGLDGALGDRYTKAESNNLLANKVNKAGGEMSGVLMGKSGAMTPLNANDVGFAFGGDSDTGVASPSDGIVQLVGNGQVGVQYDANTKTAKLLTGAGYEFVIQPDGKVVLYGTNNAVLFDSSNVYNKNQADSALNNKVSKSGDTMTGVLRAKGGTGVYTGIKGDADYDSGFEWPSDGVLRAVLNATIGFELNAPLGVSQFYNFSGWHLDLQSDGNMVWYDPTGVARWATNGTYSKADSDARFINASGDVMTGLLYANSGAGGGIRGAGDNDTGFEWTSDGVLTTLVNNAVRQLFNSSGTFLYNGAFRTDLQASDGNFVIRDGASNVIFSALGTVKKTDMTSSPNLTQGWRKIPDSNSPSGYYIEQWFTVTLPAGTVSQAVTLPVAMPNGIVSISLLPSMAAGTPPQLSTNSKSKTGFNIYKTGENAAIDCFVVGY